MASKSRESIRFGQKEKSEIGARVREFRQRLGVKTKDLAKNLLYYGDDLDVLRRGWLTSITKRDTFSEKRSQNAW